MSNDGEKQIAKMVSEKQNHQNLGWGAWYQINQITKI
jgi:hypothetical protein